MKMMSPAALAGTLLATMLALTGCSYTTMNVGSGSDITAEQMRAYAYNQSGRDLPTPIDDYPGKGRAVQMDRMITMDISFTDPDVKLLVANS